MSPLTTLGPVLVIVLAANSAKALAPPRRVDPAVGVPVSLLLPDKAGWEALADMVPALLCNVGPVTLLPERGFGVEPHPAARTAAIMKAGTLRIPAVLPFEVTFIGGIPFVRLRRGCGDREDGSLSPFIASFAREN
jgi:hypothetical protein